tara:strand:- start:2181 stop:3008 length:828 start_codon:yes stop_codon:yes gene_type:complete
MKTGLPGEQDLYNQGLTLYIEHVPTSTDKKKNFVEFSAFLDGFSDAYNSNWNAENVFGRMDPIATFSETRRALSVAWVVPSSGVDQAAENLSKINKLFTFLYPLYEQRQGASTINMGPLLKVKFGNLIQNGATGGPLLGYVNGFTMDPLLEEGMFTYAQGGPLRTGGVEYLPKAVRLNFELTVLHEHALGFRRGTDDDKDSFYLRGGSQGFPYGDKQNNVWKTNVKPPSPPKSVVKPVDPNGPAAAGQAAVTQASSGGGGGGSAGLPTAGSASDI